MPDRIEASTGEGISLTFIRGRDLAYIECLNDGEILASISPAEAASDIWDVKQAGFRLTLKKIVNFVSG